MADDMVYWVLGLSAAVNLIVVIALARVRSSTRRLKAKVAELDHALEIETSVAQHAKPPHERQVALVVNTTKSEADDVVRLVHSACSRAGMPSPITLATTEEDAGHAMARSALDQGADVVLAAGGDGTVRAVAAAVTGSQAALGVIPLGTGNLFARNIGLPYADMEACVDAAIHGMGHRVDTLSLRLQRVNGRWDEENSLVIAGGGLDAEVMGDTRESLKQRAGWLAYGEAGIRHVIGKRHTITVRLDDGDPETYRVRSILMANCGSLQANMLLVPSARMDDGLMDVVMLTPRHPWDWARIVLKTVARFSAEIPVMTVRQATLCRVEASEPLPFQLDGDAVGEVIGVETRIQPASLVVNGLTTAEIQLQPHGS